MRRRILRASVGTFVLFLTLMMVPARPATGQLSTMPLSCQDLAFSTEEDFITKGPEPPDGNPVISDGDLLSSFTDAGGNAIPVLCARNVDLLHDTFDVSVDLGLDAADVVSAEGALVAFSTELNSPNAGQFTHGDLLVTNGVMIGNRALTALWQISYDLGLDAVHFTGTSDEIIRFLDEAVQVVQPVDAAELAALLDEVPTVDILFSTEGTYVAKEAVGFLDGDLLSARTGTVVATQKDLPPAMAPAGIPTDGVDFGLDAATMPRLFDVQQLRFSTEILYRNTVAFTDGDDLRYGAGVVVTNGDLLAAFQPAARELGLDALHIYMAVDGRAELYLPLVTRDFPLAAERR